MYFAGHLKAITSAGYVLQHFITNNKVTETVESPPTLTSLVTVPEAIFSHYISEQKFYNPSRLQCHFQEASSELRPVANWKPNFGLHRKSPLAHNTGLLRDSSFWAGIPQLIFYLMPAPKISSVRHRIYAFQSSQSALPDLTILPHLTTQCMIKY